jgi:hypothetical protein
MLLTVLGPGVRRWVKDRGEILVWCANLFLPRSMMANGFSIVACSLRPRNTSPSRCCIDVLCCSGLFRCTLNSLWHATPSRSA